MSRSVLMLGLSAACLLASACSKPAGEATGQPTGPSAPAAPTVEAPAGKPLALSRAPAMSAIPLAVSSSAIDAGHRIASRYTAFGQGESPPLAWGAAAGVQTWVIMVEDPDADTPQPFLHWMTWNVPAKTMSLPAGASPTTALSGMVAGQNGGGTRGWTPPHPPAGTGDHHYHFQVFALDTQLDLPPTASRDEVIAAMKGHVLAAGETVGLAAAP